MEALSGIDSRIEIVLVDDGSTDNTTEVAEEHLCAWRDVQILRLPWNCGKGAAVRAGVSAANGSAIVFLDADLAADIGELPRLLSLLDSADVSLGSRTKAGSIVEGRTAARHFGGTVYQALVRRFTDASVVDTQCGFKAFRAPAAKLLFSMTTSTGFGFDVEILALATALGFRIEECPIRWTAVDGGHVSLRQHGLGMLQDLRRARRHQQRARTTNWNWTPPGQDTWGAAAGSHGGRPDVIRLDPPVSEPEAHLFVVRQSAG